MGCYHSKQTRTERRRQQELYNIVSDIHLEMLRIKSLSNHISYNHTRMLDKLSFIELDHKRVTI